MASSPLPYAAYSSHRRGQPSSSFVKEDGEGTPVGIGASHPNISTKASRASSSQSPSVSRSTGNDGDPKGNMTPTMTNTTPNMPPLRRAQGQAISVAGGPPPLRTISSLRAGVSPSPGSTTKNARSDGSRNTAESSSSSSGVAQDASSKALGPPRKPASSSLLVPASDNSSPLSTLQADLDTSPRLNGHLKRHSFSPITAATTPLHTRSVSSSGLPPNLPQHMSTAQRLRSVNSSSTPTGSSSNASSPATTPRGLSPSLESMMDYNLSRQASSMSLDADVIGRRTAYRPGFQPKGAYRVRTDEFVTARERRKKGRVGSSSVKAGEESKARTVLESQRLERRLEKVRQMGGSSSFRTCD
jgi:rabenosyn-5